MKTATPPKEFGCRSCEVDAVIRPEKAFEFPILAEKSVSISAKTFFFSFFGDHLFLDWKSVWISDFGRKIRFNFGENLFFFFSFFGDHLFLDWKSVWISDFGRKIRFNFGENLFFFFSFFGDHLFLDWKSVWISDFGRKIRFNFGKNLFFFFFLFSEITCFWTEKAFEFPILAEKFVSISAKTFCLEITCFWAKKAFEIPIFAEIYGSKQ